MCALKGKRFALIIDEAHSSQSGSGAQKLRSALTKGEKPKTVMQVDVDGKTVEVSVDDDIDA
mgnify:FL=1